jgi:hypothetical protein
MKIVLLPSPSIYFSSERIDQLHRNVALLPAVGLVVPNAKRKLQLQMADDLLTGVAEMLYWVNGEAGTPNFSDRELQQTKNKIQKSTIDGK